MKLKRGKKSGLKYFGYQDIKSWKPCYDPVKHIPETWRGTSVDILRMEKVPPADRLWVTLRPEITSERVMRLFAVWCARQVQHLMTDARSLNALDVAERFANGQATREELAAASAAADSAFYAAYTSAAAAASYAASAAAYAADTSAASYASASAYASYASASASYAYASASYAARAAAWATQVSKLIEMLQAEGRERIAEGGRG